ncbi:MAG: amino acid ABC transporter permease [Acidaminobacteraceae bacterium]
MNYVLELLPPLFVGMITTLKVFAFTLLFSVPLGVIISILRLSKNKAVNKITRTYILVMRGTPLLLQIIFVFFGLPTIGIVFDRFTSIILAFTLNYAAYFGEIFRSGLSAVDRGQYEAATMLGMSKIQALRRVVLPQVIKITLPVVANEVITLVKDTSLVYIVGISDLLRVGKIASNRDVTLLPLLMVGLVYLTLTAIFTKAFDKLEESLSYYE